MTHKKKLINLMNHIQERMGILNNALADTSKTSCFRDQDLDTYKAQKLELENILVCLGEPWNLFYSYLGEGNKNDR